MNLAQMLDIATGVGFQSRVAQTEHSVAKGSSPLRRFFGAVLPRRNRPRHSLQAFA